MYVERIYDTQLAQAAYLIGCQRTGEAVVIDPERDIDRYVQAAAANGLRITAVTETHIHADYLSGTRELAEATGAKVYVSDEGDADWKYQWLDQKCGGGSYLHQLLHDGDAFKVGNVQLTVSHTPGHTPEHIAFLVTDLGGGATEPIAIATGDFVFVGDLGRPDLLETAAGQAGAKEPSARRLYQSLQSFLELPEYLQVWPAHGAGSACGKALGAIPQSTVGYEKRFSSAIRAATSEDAFVKEILAGQPEPPLYFARMKRENKIGPRVLGGLPAPRELGVEELARVDGGKVAIVDTRPWEQYRAGALPKSLSIPMSNALPTEAGSFIDAESGIVLIAAEQDLEGVVRALVRVGLDRIVGWARPEALSSMDSLQVMEEIDVGEARRRIDEAGWNVLDVRRATEYAEVRVPGGQQFAHTRLAAHLKELPTDKPLVVHCRGGARSARACSLLRRAGFEVANLAGGMMAWERAGAPVERGSK